MHLRQSLFLFCFLILVRHSVSGQQFAEAQKVNLAPPPTARDFRDRGDGVLWSAKIIEPSALYMRLHFSDIASPDGADYQVVVRDRQEKAIAHYSSRDFGREETFLTGPLFTSKVTVEVQGAHTNGLSFALDYYLRERDPTGRVIAEGTLPNWRGPGDLLPKEAAAIMESAGEAIAKLYTGTGHVCTGFLVSEKAVLTNYHCLETSTMFLKDQAQKKTKCGDVALQFDFRFQSQPQKSIMATCLSVVSYDEVADYALLLVDPGEIAKGQAKRRFLHLSVTTAPRAEEVIVLHHPAGLSLRISLGCLAYSNLGSQILEHDCATVGGSSGAPLLAYDGTVVGLHHDSGVPESMTFGELRKALEDGRVFLNRATPASELRRLLAIYLP